MKRCVFSLFSILEFSFLVHFDEGMLGVPISLNPRMTMSSERYRHFTEPLDQGKRSQTTLLRVSTQLEPNQKSQLSETRKF